MANQETYDESSIRLRFVKGDEEALIIQVQPSVSDWRSERLRRKKAPLSTRDQNVPAPAGWAEFPM